MLRFTEKFGGAKLTSCAEVGPSSGKMNRAASVRLKVDRNVVASMTPRGPLIRHPEHVKGKVAGQAGLSGADYAPRATSVELLPQAEREALVLAVGRIHGTAGRRQARNNERRRSIDFNREATSGSSNEELRGLCGSRPAATVEGRASMRMERGAGHGAA